jgi:tetratricopeptide (TPR) repeat protein
MKTLQKARSTVIPRQAQKVFLSCDAANANNSDGLIADLLLMDAGLGCVVSYFEMPGTDIDEALLRDELQENQVLVLWVTIELVRSMNDGTFPAEYRIAQELRVPIFPIASDGGLFPALTNLTGAIHGIAIDDAEYRTKLKAQLETFLASEEIVKEIQEKAFTARIFLSYRKIDIHEARQFMKAFHDLEKFEAISIWYDNFLVAGRNFNYEIEESITNSDMFVLLVTPNLATEGNYVQTTEYPFARQKGKPVVSAEAVPTDLAIFSSLYPGAECAVPVSDPAALRDAFLSKLNESAYQWQKDSEHAYLLGMAYLKGLGVERDYTRAIRLLELASEVCNPHALRAVKQLANMYENGIGSDILYDKALHWCKKATVYSEELFGLNHPNTAEAYNNIAVVYDEQGDYSQALEWCRKTLAISEKVLGSEHPATSKLYNDIGLAYSNQGDYPKALEWYQKALVIIETTVLVARKCCAAYGNRHSAGNIT